MCTVQNGIATHMLELYSNNQFILTIEIGRMNIAPFVYQIIFIYLGNFTPFSIALK